MKIICLHCDEEILPWELMPERAGQDQQLHRECLLRSIAGSLAHQQRKCSCYGGRGDDENLSFRANAKAAADYFTGGQEKIQKTKFK